MITKDIVVSGGGLAGMVAAVAFAQAGFDTLCVDPAPVIPDQADPSADLRTTAFLQPARQFLETLGIWDHFDPVSMPLDVMRIVDAGSPDSPAQPRVTKDFRSEELSDLPFGWNVPNWQARRCLAQIMADMPNLEFRAATHCDTLFTRETQARVRLSDGDTVTCQMVIAADGRGSKMRQEAGIDIKTTRFGQKALAFAVSHVIPHKNVSTEIHRSGGPFTLVPLPDRDGMPASAMVWMERGPRATELVNMPKADFEQEMTDRSCSILGPLTLISRRSIWPIISQIADRLSAQRVALVAEAAHVVPPIGAQGLNMSLNDIKTLLELCKNDRNAIGTQPMLDRYHSMRYRDIQTRVLGITALNKTSMLDAQPLRDARAMGINALYALPQVRRSLMQMGLGTG